MMYDSVPAASPADLQSLVERAAQALFALSDQDVTLRATYPGPSPKETLGHLVDEATRSQMRFEQALTKGHLVFEPGEADEAMHYGEADWTSLVTLWWMSSTHLLRTMAAVSDDDRFRPHAQHNLHESAWLPVLADEPVTLNDLVWDYADHLRYHLGALLPELAAGVPSPAQSL